jgi:hypothetical protein
MKLTLPLRAVYGPACGDKPWEPCQANTGVPRTSAPSGPSLRSYHTERNENNRHSRNLAYVKHILIVDASPLVRRCLRDLLEQESGLVSLRRSRERTGGN